MKFLLIFLSLILIPGASANTLSFSDFDLTTQEIDIYYSNGTLFSTIKSNESISLDSSVDYQLVFRPEKISILNDPSILLDYAMDFLPILLSIVALVILAGVLGFKKFKFW